MNRAAQYRLSRLLPWVGAALLLALLSTLTLLAPWSRHAGDDRLTIRKVELYVATPPPPPPPPPVVKRAPAEPRIAIAAQGGGPALALKPLAVDDRLVLRRTRAAPLALNTDIDWNSSLEVDWSEGFALTELDERPRLLTALNVQFPQSLSRRGIGSATAVVEVVIDEAGGVTLQRIVENPHPEIAPVIVRLIGTARFSAPKKNGVAVKAKYTWPLEFKQR